MTTKDYTIKTDENGVELCKFHFEWTDTNGQLQVVDTDNVDAAATVIGLLSGDICLSDLEP